MFGPFTPTVRLVQRMVNLHDRFIAAIHSMGELETADRTRPVTPERMAAAVALCAEARRLLSRHKLSAALPRLRAEPPMVAGALYIELVKAQRIVHEICILVADLSPGPEEVL